MNVEGIYFFLLAFGLANARSVVNIMETDCSTSGTHLLRYSVNNSMTLQGATYNGYAPLTCSAVIQAASPTKRVMIGFQLLNLKPTDIIYVYDGPSTSSSPFTAHPMSSSTAADETFYKSTGRELTVTFSSAAGQGYSTGFKALVTEFHEGKCGSHEFECCDEVCISDTLEIDLEYNCEAKNDEAHSCADEGLHYSTLMWIIIGSVVGGILFIVVVGCIIGCCISANQRKANRRRRSNNPPLTTVAYPRSVAGPGIPMTNLATVSGYPQQHPQQGYPAAAYSFITPPEAQAMAPPPYQTVDQQNAAAVSPEQPNTSL